MDLSELGVKELWSIAVTEENQSDIDKMVLAGREALKDGLFTRRQYLTLRLCMDGANIWEAIEAIASTAIEHPEWDMDEEKTWHEWNSL